MISRTQRNLPPWERCHVPKLIGADHCFGKNKASGILLPNAPSGIGESRVCSDEFPVRSHEFPVPVKNRESCAMHWDCSANRLGSGRNALKWSEVSKIAC